MLNTEHAVVPPLHAGITFISVMLLLVKSVCNMKLGGGEATQHNAQSSHVNSRPNN